MMPTMTPIIVIGSTSSAINAMSVITMITMIASSTCTCWMISVTPIIGTAGLIARRPIQYGLN